jgi:hypothetical protein
MLVIVYPFYAPIFMPAGKARYSRTRRFASPAAKIFSLRVYCKQTHAGGKSISSVKRHFYRLPRMCISFFRLLICSSAKLVYPVRNLNWKTAFRRQGSFCARLHQQTWSGR